MMKAKIRRRTRIDVNSVACNRCKSRKQKCTGNFSTGKPCLGCERANVACEYSKKKTPYYVKSLEKRIKYLEQLLKQEKGGNAEVDNGLAIFDQSYTESPVVEENEEEEEEEEEEDEEEVVLKNAKKIANKGNSNLGADVLTKCAALFPLKDDMEPLYVGSSGLNIASLLQENLKLEIADSLKFSNIQKDIYQSTTLNEYVSRSLDDLLYDGIKLNQFVETYISRIHNKYPFLRRDDIYELHNNRESYLKSGKAHDNKTDMLNSFILLMIYAIGSMMVSRKTNQPGMSNPSYENDDFVFFTSAIKLDLSVVFKHKGILNIHSMLLTVLYQLRLPNGPVIWDMIGFALRLCVSFGFHRKNIDLLHQRPLVYQQRMLTFWSAYSLERTISSSFGRPFTLSDLDIDVDLPINIDESITDGSLLIKEYYLTLKDRKSKNVTSRMQAIHHFKFVKIESEIQNKIYRVDTEFESIPREEINDIILKMKQWASDIPPSSSAEYDYYLYLFNKQIRFLLQPFLCKLKQDDPLFVECIEAASTVCQLSKRMYQNTKTRLSFIALQTVFLSGVTMVYGLLSRKFAWNFSISEGVRCCSDVLFSVAQRAYTCGIFSEIFEKLVAMVQENDKGNDRDCNDKNTFRVGGRIDLFGQDELRKNVHDTHRKENLEVFNEISLKDENLKEFENLFDFANLDFLGTNKLDALVKRTSTSAQFIEQDTFMGFFE